jgi:hypothetical protein
VLEILEEEALDLADHEDLRGVPHLLLLFGIIIGTRIVLPSYICFFFEYLNKFMPNIMYIRFSPVGGV